MPREPGNTTTYRMTKIFLADDGTSIHLRFYTTTAHLHKGIWNTDTNQIILTMPMYEDYWECRPQAVSMMRKFLDSLQKISSFNTPQYIEWERLFLT